MDDIKSARWDEFSDLEIVNWKRIRNAIEHENTLLNHRFTWLLTSQAFLSSAFYYIWKASIAAAAANTDKLPLQFFLLTTVGTGLFTSLHLALGLRTAHEQHDVFKNWWNDRYKDLDRHPSICGSHPLFPYYWFGFVFTFGWIILGIIGFFDFNAPYKNVVGFLIAASVIFGVGLLGGRILEKRSKSKKVKTTPTNKASLHAPATSP